MSRKANPAVVGIFVIIAITLLTAAVIIFGKGAIFKETRDWVLYFEGSIKGLTPGSFVVFKGVRIGEVKDIRVKIDEEGNISTPVMVQLDASLVDFEATDRKEKEALACIRKMIDKGLRAQLETQSLITGQLLIQLGFHPEKEAVYRATGGPLPEIPTISSAVQEFSKTLDSLPINEITTNIHEITKNLNMLISSPELKEGLNSLGRSLKNIDSFISKMDKKITPVSEETCKLLKSTDALINSNNDKLAALLEDLKKTSETMRSTIEKTSADMTALAAKTDEGLTGFLETATVTVESADKMISGQSRFRHDLNKTLEELNSALRSIHLLAEYLEQHPEALIKGKKE